ncbi:MAG: BtaA family protein [Planctomycetales bacterium]|nr:BtaA family protein [Planctomycetales bacterium]
MTLGEYLSGRMFQFVHGHNLVYNTCWEDPRLDREAMELTGNDNVLVITSAGCNALDYALDEPNRVDAVDMNPRQNALLELKKAGIRHLEFEDFFQMFGKGQWSRVREVYRDTLRSSLSPWSQQYWDRWIRFFDNRRRPFYFRGTSGNFARAINIYVDRVLRLRPVVNEMLEARTIEEQRWIYDNHLRDRLWTRSLRFAIERDTTLSMLGVPRPQREQIERDYHGGMSSYVKDCLEAVLSKLPLADNYFWRVYITGSYTPECCPEYLKPESFQRLKDGLVDRVHVHTNSVQGFLESVNHQFSRYVLLDHMDWLSTYRFSWLESEWQAILDRAAPNARVLWRSGGLRTDFVEDVRVNHNGQLCSLRELLKYHEQWARELHERDRVHTYASFFIADLAA